MIQQERISILNEGEPAVGGNYVLYWMQRSQREGCNHALEYAAERANELDLPLRVLFVLTPSYPEATSRHYRFMLEGLSVTAERLRARGIDFHMVLGDPVETVLACAEGSVSEGIPEAFSRGAALLVGDRGYLRTTRLWRKEIASRISIPYHEVETDLIVPVETASDKEEYTAGTFRPKLHRRLFHFLVPLERRQLRRPVSSTRQPAWPDLSTVFGENAVPSSEAFETEAETVGREAERENLPRGGEERAEELLGRFIEEKLPHFDDLRNDPTRDYTSGLSPYLHFGQISPLTVALAALEREDAPSEGFLEELVVRRELSFNFTWYNDRYDSLEALPRWARETLELHNGDTRDPVYRREDFERAETHDLYWNAAQRELLITGKMHGYMRMYWGKKILEWSGTVEEAFETALYLNNRYALDGRDPNSFAGIAWCFGKHDRAWKERSVFGKVRYMNERGLKRKFKIDDYVRKINRLGSPEAL